MSIPNVNSILGQLAKGNPIDQVMSGIKGAGGLVQQAASHLPRPNGVGTTLVNAMKHPHQGHGQQGGKRHPKQSVRTEKASYMAILTHAVAKAHDEPHFDLASSIREVQNKLAHIHQSKSKLDHLHDTLESAGMEHKLEEAINALGQGAKTLKQKIGLG